jgi:hypothetical protein
MADDRRSLPEDWAVRHETCDVRIAARPEASGIDCAGRGDDEDLSTPERLERDVDETAVVLELGRAGDEHHWLRHGRKPFWICRRVP